MVASLGFGVTAGLGADVVEPLAREVERLGYESFWTNDLARPDADGLATLAAVHGAVARLALGVGVVPLDRRSPTQIAAEVHRLGLPLDRLRLGVGSGGDASRPLGLVRDGVEALRRELPGVRLFVAALGPRMVSLAGEIADGVLLNWATPARVTTAVAGVRRAATEAGRDPGDVAIWAYVRAAVGPDARARLAAEAARYAQSAAYGRQFREMGAPLEAVGVAAVGEADLRRQLTPYLEALDGVVVRALPAQPVLGDLLAIARAGAQQR